MAVKKDIGAARMAPALTHHGHGGGTSKLSHNRSKAATHPADRIATLRLRILVILPL
jgi:hypothetical protein